MVALFQERYRDLPGFQKALETVEYLRNGWLSDEEVATRIMMLVEYPLSWDTLCHNCASLMDNNYAQYVEIQKLNGELQRLKASPVMVICGRCGRGDSPNTGHYCNPDS